VINVSFYSLGVVFHLPLFQQFSCSSCSSLIMDHEPWTRSDTMELLNCCSVGLSLCPPFALICASTVRNFTPGCFKRNGATSTKDFNAVYFINMHELQTLNLNINLLCVTPHWFLDSKSFISFILFHFATLSFHS